MKRALSVLLAVIMVISACPVSAFATSSEEVSDEDNLIVEADMSVSGSEMPDTDELEEDNAVYSYGDYQYTILADGTISICGYSGVPQNREDGIFLEIPASIDGIQVSQIAEEAFAYNEYIYTVMIPESVISVGNAAFYHCTVLRAIAFCGACPILGITVAEGSRALERVFALKDSNIATFCALLVNDLGEDGARSVEIVECDDLVSLKAAFNDYADSLAENSESEDDIPASNEEDVPVLGNDEIAVIAEEDTSASDNILAEGSCGENLTWALDDEGVLTISGSGAMEIYSSGATPWYSYAANITSLVLSDDITTIGSYAFQSCTGMTGGLTIPGAVTSIGSYAFSGCTGLDGKLVIEAGTKTIGTYAFQNCSKLTGLELGNGITSIGDYAFYGCSGMTGDLIIPDSVTSIGNNVFSGCAGFNGTLTLSENLTSIGQYAFQSCSGFTGELEIPSKITSLNLGVFSGMSGITSVVVGESVTSIYTYYSGSYATYNSFYKMSGVKEVTFLGLTVPTMTNNSYSPFNYMTKLETIYVPAGVYSAYVSAYSKYVSDSVVFSTNFISAKVSNFKAEKVYSKTVVLSWNPHTSNNVVGYTVYRDGEVIGTTTECSFVDHELVTGTSYTYSVRGYTNDGTMTPATEITVTPIGPRILDIKTANSQNKLDDDHNTVYIYVSNDKNLQPLGEEETTGKLYYVRNGAETFIGSTTFSQTLGSASTGVFTIDWDISALEDGEYTLKFVLTDIDGATATYSESASIDRSVPAQIVGVTAVGDVQKIYLSWAISSEADTNIYRIYRQAESDEVFRLIAQINNRNTLTYTDTNVKTDRIYYYYVVGVNEFGQEGEKSEIAGATLSSDTEAPTVTKLTPANASYLTGTANLSLTAEDNVSVVKAALYYSIDNRATWTLIAEMNSGNFKAALDTTAIRDGVIHIKGVAYDAAGNESSALVYVYSIDNTGPEQVTGLAYESTDVTITLSWDDVADDDIRYYRVERKNADGSYSTVSDVYSTLGLNIYNLVPETEYTYRVVGYDMQGNRGTPAEDITAATLADTTAPVITKIRPISGYYSTSISLSITATDEYNVSKILLQTSTDALSWTDVYVKSYSDINKTRTLSYELPLDGYDEGVVYVRAIATDVAGNESDSSVNAPYVQHIVDRTAPSAPDSVKATGNNGYIEISWVQGSETDLDKYSVYRAASENGTFHLLKDAIAATNYIDRNVEEGTVYYYKVTVNDVAGNESESSAIVSAEVVKDKEVPEIYSVYPGTGSSLGVGFKSVSVLAIDNNALNTVLIEYSADGENYNTLHEKSGINAYNITLSADIPVSGFNDGDTVYVRFSATDVSGNTCEYAVYAYTIDAAPPSVKSAAAEFVDGNVYITWTGNMEEDLSAYRIYRKTGLTGSYSLFAQRQAVDDQKAYSCYDSNLSDKKVTYYYKIEAVDQCGNTSSIATNAVTLPDRSMPTPVISCESTQEIGVEYIIDGSLSKDNTGIVSYLFDFGDGTTSTAVKPIHIYEETGEYTITLTVTDDDGNTSTTTKVISVKDRSLIGMVKIRIVDENGVSVAGAPVYFDLGAENQVVKYTDSNGYIIFTADVGKHTVGCIIANNEWLPVKKDVIVSAGAETSTTMTMVHHALIEGQFEITRMTFEEIVAVGIDISKPENQHIVKVNVTLTYSDTV